MSSPIDIPRALPLRSSPSQNENEKKLRDASQMYEQHFLQEMVKAMRKTIPEGEGILPSGFAEKIYRDQLDNQYVESWAQQGGVGLADLIFNQLKEKVLGPSSTLSVPHGPLAVPSRMVPLPISSPINKESIFLFQPSSLPSSSLLSPSLLPPSLAEVTSPWSGQVVAAFQSAQGRSVIQLRHEDGVESNLNYIGRNEHLPVGQQVAQGQRIGLMSDQTSGLVWRVTKNVSEGA